MKLQIIIGFVSTLFLALKATEVQKKPEELNKNESYSIDPKKSEKRSFLGFGFGYGHGLHRHYFEGIKSLLGGYRLGNGHANHVTITKKVPVPVPYPVVKKIPYPVKVPIQVPVDRPYPVHIAKPYPVPVEKPVPYPVVKHVPYPVKVAVEVPVVHKVPVPYPKPFPVYRNVPYPVKVPVVVEKRVPIYIKEHGNFEEHKRHCCDKHSY